MHFLNFLNDLHYPNDQATDVKLKIIKRNVMLPKIFLKEVFANS